MKKSFVSIPLLSVLFLLACTPANRSGQPEPRPPLFTETLLSTSSISETPTEVPHVTPNPATLTPERLPTEVAVFAPTFIMPTLQVGRSIQLASIHMVDAQIGWGIKLGEGLRPGFQGDPYLRPPEGYILRTADGGKTWQNVTPPTGGYSPKGFFALDANFAWANSNIPCCKAQNTTRLWRTQDGGKTWQASQPFSTKVEAEVGSEFYLPLQIQFVDPKTGWLLSSSRTGMGDRLRAMLLHTTDGGDTWAPMQFGVNGFMVNCWNGGLAFISSTTGWYGTSCVGSPRVFQFNTMFGEGGWKILKTTDGGNSFTESTLIPTPPDLQELAASNPDMDCGERRVIAFTPNALGVEWECRNYVTYEKYSYFSLSTDDGVTWNTWIPSGNEYFLGATYGWRLLNPGQLQQTTDSGATWTTIKTVAWDNAQFDFISEQEGWAIVSSGNVNALVYSADGGKTWLEIKPVIAP